MKTLGQKLVPWLRLAALVLTFVLVMSFFTGAIHLVFTLISSAFGYEASLAQPSVASMIVVLLIWLVMARGAVSRLLDVRAGGAALASRFGAVPVSAQSSQSAERQLVNLVAEVAVAATTVQPDVYILRNERAVNAFSLGNGVSQPVIVITEGALKDLDKHRMRALVAHEFAHIVSNDLQLNMQLLCLSGGLMAKDELGKQLMSRCSTFRSHPGWLLGYLICLFAKPGVFAGRLAAAALCRGREYAADARAIQLTGNTFAFASVLDAVKARCEDPTLRVIHVNQLMPLCFQVQQEKRWLSKFISTHPDVSLRIMAIDSDFATNKRNANNRKIEELALGTTTDTYEFTTIAANDNFVDYDKSDRIMLLLPDQSICMAALFALFAQKNPEQKSNYLSAMSVSFHQEFIDKVKQVLELLPDELKHDQLGVIAHASSVLNKQMSMQNRQRIAVKLENLLSVIGKCNLMDYALLQLIRRMLQIEFPLINKIADGNESMAKARKVKDVNGMGREFALLLSMIVDATGAPPEQLDKQFAKLLKCYTKKSFPRRTANEPGIVKELEAAFQLLYVQPKPIRHSFVHHCREIIRHSGKSIPNERALLDLFAASLRCDQPMAAA